MIPAMFTILAYIWIEVKENYCNMNKLTQSHSIHKDKVLSNPILSQCFYWQWWVYKNVLIAVGTWHSIGHGHGRHWEICQTTYYMYIKLPTSSPPFPPNKLWKVFPAVQLNKGGDAILLHEISIYDESTQWTFGGQVMTLNPISAIHRVCYNF